MMPANDLQKPTNQLRLSLHPHSQKDIMQNKNTSDLELFQVMPEDYTVPVLKSSRKSKTAISEENVRTLINVCTHSIDRWVHVISEKITEIPGAGINHEVNKARQRIYERKKRWRAKAPCLTFMYSTDIQQGPNNEKIRVFSIYAKKEKDNNDK